MAKVKREDCVGLLLAKREELLLDGRPAAVFTHGGPIAVMMAALFPEENKNRYQWQPEPGRGYAIDTLAGTYTPI